MYFLSIAGDKKVASGIFAVKPDTVYTLSLEVDVRLKRYYSLTTPIQLIQGDSATVSVNGNTLSSNVMVGSGKGFVGFGTSGYFPAEFDNFSLAKGNN